MQLTLQKTRIVGLSAGETYDRSVRRLDTVLAYDEQADGFAMASTVLCNANNATHYDYKKSRYCRDSARRRIPTGV